MEKEKERITNDFDLLKKELINLIDDMSIQFLQNVDEHFTIFID